MKLIVGLGNPGEEYKDTRHNVGFKVIDALAHSQRLTANGDFKMNRSLHAELLEGLVDDIQITLMKPQKFMNNSGLVVKKIAVSRGLSAVSDVIVIHDDLTLDLGVIKISRGAGAGNHNGVQSIIDHMKTRDFIRVRCGIGRGEGVLTNVVLSKFRPDEHMLVESMIQKAAEACMDIVRHGGEKAMNKYN